MSPELPTGGWCCTAVVRRPGRDTPCGACGRPTGRYAHTLMHPNLSDLLTACAACAARLADGYPADAVERAAADRARRFSLFVIGWHVDRRGFLYRRWRGAEYRIGLAPDGYRAWLGGTPLPVRFPDADAALAAAFAATEPPVGPKGN